MISLNEISQEPTQIILAVSVVGTLALLVFHSFNRQSDEEAEKLKSFRRIPAPKGELPYVGHLFSLGKNPPATLIKLQKEIGPIMRVQMGVQPWLLISDPLLAHELFVTRGISTSDRPDQTFNKFHSLSGTRGIALVNATKTWKRTRTAALSILSPKNVDRYTPILVQEADSLLEKLLSLTAKDGQVHPIDIFQSASLNVILTTCLGMRANSLDDPLFKKVAYLMNKGMKLASLDKEAGLFLPVLRFVDTLVGTEATFRHFINVERDPFFKQLIKTAVEGDQECFVKSLHEMKEEYEMDDANILTATVDTIFAGGDTVSVSLAWMVAILCHHPEVQQKLRDEIDAFIKVNKRLPDFSERDQLPYLIAVTKESLRYRPTAPFGLPHRATEDIDFHGYIIPKDTTLISNMWPMHHNPKAFDRPEEFIPERYMDNLKTMFASANGKIESRDHYNFGWGRRICPGIYLAEVELFIILVRLFALCKIEPGLNKKGEPVYPDLDIVRDGGLVILPEAYKARFIKRSDAVLV